MGERLRGGGVLGGDEIYFGGESCVCGGERAHTRVSNI